MCHTSAKGYTVKGVYWSFTDLPTPKRQKMWYSEPELGKKWEMGKKSWEISVSLWVLEVTISLKAGAVNMTINFQFRFCKFCVLLAPFWNKRNSKSPHLVAAASCAVAKRIVAFDYILLLFSLGWAGCLLISNLETNPTAPKCFGEKSLANSWERERGTKIVRLATKSWDLTSLLLLHFFWYKKARNSLRSICRGTVFCSFTIFVFLNINSSVCKSVNLY